MGVHTINTMGTNYSYLKIKLKMENCKVKKEYELKELKFQLSTFLQFRYIYLHQNVLFSALLFVKKGSII
jgi:hypothetical protein